jgi:uncharacterized protein YodC (DUF2158 family)
MNKVKYKAGNLVRLKSGGPVMTVECLDEIALLNGSVSYCCLWFAGKKLDKGDFPEDALLPATEEDLK